MAATHDLACPVRNARLLLSTRPTAMPADPLFELHWGGFQREDVLTALRNRLTLIGEPTTRLTGHSFRRGAAQHAYDRGLSTAEIQQPSGPPMWWIGISPRIPPDGRTLRSRRKFNWTLSEESNNTIGA
ncbi:hypothetical protein E4U40_006081 [Claviceps sp. LM458 group G5]|nr:hypothetical protein E4U40_006081 [Claviceps sp. LM458 group G5]